MYFLRKKICKILTFFPKLENIRESLIFKIEITTMKYHYKNKIFITFKK